MSPLITWNVLKSLGFKEDKGVISDPPGGLSCHFDGFKLSASVCINRSFYPIILFTGVYATERTIGEVNFETHGSPKFGGKFQIALSAGHARDTQHHHGARR